jgi:excisionase family DNA binding protein
MPTTTNDDERQQAQEGSMALTEGPLLNVRDVAKVLGLTEWTVRRMARARRLPYVRLGRPILFEERELAAWVRDHRVTPTG